MLVSRPSIVTALPDGDSQVLEVEFGGTDERIITEGMLLIRKKLVASSTKTLVDLFEDIAGILIENYPNAGLKVLSITRTYPGVGPITYLPEK